MQLRAQDIRTIADDMEGKPEDLTGHERERREAMERYGVQLLDDWAGYKDTEQAEELAIRDVLLGFGAGFDVARGKVRV